MDVLELQWIWGPSVRSTRIDHMTTYPPPYFGQLAQYGQYFGTYTPTSDTMTLTADEIYYVPLVIPYPLVIDVIGFNITTADAGADGYVGVYAFERGKLDDLIATTDQFSFTGTGFKSLSIEVAVTAGIYAFALHCSTSVPEVRKCSVAETILPETAGTATSPNSHYRETQSFDSLPTTPTATLNSGDCPRIVARRQA